MTLFTTTRFMFSALALAAALLVPTLGFAGDEAKDKGRGCCATDAKCCVDGKCTKKDAPCCKDDCKKCCDKGDKGEKCEKK